MTTLAKQSALCLARFTAVLAACALCIGACTVIHPKPTSATLTFTVDGKEMWTVYEEYHYPATGNEEKEYGQNEHP